MPPRLTFKTTTLYALCVLFVVDILISFNYFFSNVFLTRAAVDANKVVCPPYFKDCLFAYVLDAPPQGYSQNILFMIIGTFIFVALFFLYKKNFTYFSWFISVPLFFKIALIYFLTYLIPGNFHVFGIFFGLILLFSLYKIFFLRLLIVAFYLCASVVKIHEGYVTGTVFSSLALGAPIVPDTLLPYVGVGFFLMCSILPLFLLSTIAKVRLTALALLTIFHLYSITMVGFRYPILLLPILWLLFYFEEEKIVFQKQYLKDYVGVLIISLMVFLQFVPLFIQGDERLTGEGYRYGYYMYDGNHQCVSTKKVFFNNGETKDIVWENTKAMYACDPYEEWYKIQRWCDPKNVSKIAWTYDHSLNGALYRRIVNVENACGLLYHPFSHNAWINEQGEILQKSVIKNSI